MNYAIHGLEPASFESLFGLDDAALAARGIQRVRADAAFGYPCRLTLEDAPVGAELLLLNYTHLDADSPYRASGPIFVQKGVTAPRRISGELPGYLTRRLLSVRAYDDADMMVAAEVVEGAAAAPVFGQLLSRPDVCYLHVHFAKRGCYAARIERA
ncbi:MAG: DUF1203 domain-containing protein [Gammaproteobacteria bacterium]